MAGRVVPGMAGWCRLGGGGGGGGWAGRVGPGGAGWRSIGYGPGRVHRVVPVVNVPINGSAGVCVLSEW